MVFDNLDPGIMMVIVVAWSLFSSWILLPYFTLRKFMRELERPRFRSLVVEYLIGALQEERMVKADDGSERSIPVFSLFMGHAWDYFTFRFSQWANGQKSAMSRNIDGIVGDNPMAQLLYAVLPNKHKDFAGVIAQFMGPKQEKEAAAQGQVQEKSSKPKYL